MITANQALTNTYESIQEDVDEIFKRIEKASREGKTSIRIFGKENTVAIRRYLKERGYNITVRGYTTNVNW